MVRPVGTLPSEGISQCYYNFDLLINCFFKCKVFEESFKWLCKTEKLSNSSVEGFNSENRKLY